jgi:hypothetical protein
VLINDTARDTWRDLPPLHSTWNRPSNFCFVSQGKIWVDLGDEEGLYCYETEEGQSFQWRLKTGGPGTADRIAQKLPEHFDVLAACSHPHATTTIRLALEMSEGPRVVTVPVPRAEIVRAALAVQNRLLFLFDGDACVGNRRLRYTWEGEGAENDELHKYTVLWGAIMPSVERSCEPARRP